MTDLSWQVVLLGQLLFGIDYLLIVLLLRSLRYTTLQKTLTYSLFLIFSIFSIPLRLYYPIDILATIIRGSIRGELFVIGTISGFSTIVFGLLYWQVITRIHTYLNRPDNFDWLVPVFLVLSGLVLELPLITLYYPLPISTGVLQGIPILMKLAIVPVVMVYHFDLVEARIVQFQLAELYPQYEDE